MRKKIKKIIMTFAMVLTVMAAVKASTIEAQAAGQFDPTYYAQTYPDVAAALGTDAEALYNHYVNFGQKEGRIPYAGGQPGETVDGIANATAETPAVQTPTANTVDIGDGPFWLYSTGEEVDKETFMREYQRVQQHFDASGYVHAGWTEEQVQAKLLSLKDVYPEGKVVGICSQGAGLIENALYGPRTERGVVGWAYDKETDECEPVHVKGVVVCRKTSDPDFPLRVGDVLYTEGPNREGHVSVVISRDSEGITVVESNSNNDKAMHWGRRIPWNELQNGRSSDSKYVRQNQRFALDHFEY